jgi:hypothetical protein
MSIAVILPTRGRPEKAREAVDSILETRRLPDTQVVVVLDQDDPSRPLYEQWLGMSQHIVVVCEGKMIQRANIAAMRVVGEFDILGFMADDNRMRTPGWDIRVTRTLEQSGILFTNLNDQFWSELFPNDKPVNTYIRSSVVQALGWFANPHEWHHYMDDSWRLLGTSTDSIVYLRDVICEHLHPTAQKGERDAGYDYTDSQDLLYRDQQQFMQWIWKYFREDREKVKTCLGS